MMRQPSIMKSRSRWAKYDRLVKTMRAFLKERERAGVAYFNGELPRAQQIKMDSLIKQAVAIHKLDNSD